MPRKHKAGYGGRKAISGEISHLVRERGYTQKRAVAAALSQARGGKLGRSAVVAVEAYGPAPARRSKRKTTRRGAMARKKHRARVIPASRRLYADTAAARAYRAAHGGDFVPRARKTRRASRTRRLAPAWWETLGTGVGRKRRRRKTTGRSAMPKRRKRRARRGTAQHRVFASKNKNFAYYHPPIRKGRKRRRQRIPIVRFPKRGHVLVRNPKGIMGVVLHGVTDAAAIIAGKAAVRFADDKLAQYITALRVDTSKPSGVMLAVAKQAALAVGAGIVADKVAGRRSDLARFVTAGGFVAPLETLLKYTFTNSPEVQKVLLGDGSLGAYGPIVGLPPTYGAAKPHARFLTGARMGAYPQLDTVATPGYGEDY